MPKKSKIEINHTDTRKSRRMVYAVTKNDDVLGLIHYIDKWKEWIFRPMGEGTIWSEDCLTEISDELAQLNMIEAGDLAPRPQSPIDIRYFELSEDGIKEGFTQNGTPRL